MPNFSPLDCKRSYTQVWFVYLECALLIRTGLVTTGACAVP